MTVHFTVGKFFSNAQLQKAIFSFNFGSGQSLKCLNEQSQSFDLWVNKHSIFLVRNGVSRFSRLNILGTLLKTTQKVTSCEVPNKKVKENWLASIREPEPVIFPLTAYLGKENERCFSRRCKNGSRLNILGTLLKTTQKVTSCLLSNEKLEKNWLGSLTQSKSHVLCFLPTNGNSPWNY